MSVDDRINSISRDWALVRTHCTTRINELIAELSEEGHSHGELVDAQRRARIDELKNLLDLANPKP